MSSNLTNGITIRGIPLHQAYPGRVFFVSNTTTATRLPKSGVAGVDGTPNDGSYLRPWKTIDYAVGQTTASRGDIILVMPGHSEILSLVTNINGLTLDVAGIAIVGLGAGTSRPLITLGVATGEEALSIAVSANNISVKNLRFAPAGTLDIVTCFLTSTAADFNVEGCEFRDSTSILNFLSLVKTGTTSNKADGLRFANNRVQGLNTTPLAVVNILETMSRLQIVDNFVIEAATSGGELWTSAAKVLTDVLVKGNVFLPIGATGTTTGILTTSTGTINNTGIIADNLIASLDTTTEIIATVGTSYGWVNNWYTGVADKSGYGLPTLDT